MDMKGDRITQLDMNNFMNNFRKRSQIFIKSNITLY